MIRLCQLRAVVSDTVWIFFIARADKNVECVVQCYVVVSHVSLVYC
jgi:hypothetical protein